MAVREIKGWNPITHLPKQPAHMRGVLNLRGVMVPIVDLRCRLGEGLTETTPMHVVIVVQIGAQAVGLLADRVLDIVSIGGNQVQPVPRMSRAGRRNYLSGLVTVEGPDDRAARSAASSWRRTCPRCPRRLSCNSPPPRLAESTSDPAAS